MFVFSVGEKIIYGENGVCTIDTIAPLPLAGSPPDKMYYYLTPYIGTGTFYTPIDSSAYMRAIISREEAEELIASIPFIEPAVCKDNRFNHVDSFYRGLIKQHDNAVLISVIKGLTMRLNEKKIKSSRAEITMKRAKDILHGELSVALGIEVAEVEGYIQNKIEHVDN